MKYLVCIKFVGDKKIYKFYCDFITRHDNILFITYNKDNYAEIDFNKVCYYTRKYIGE